ncbi:E3 ubiquitin-protein ligase RGLG2-like [Punica granatum]|uniref:E3 ubiquitin-protein ligase RGLG2-like n=2 Tax=Punica granatum TaxID=22663 RepID=A0A6P8CM15_PUNGR|nr:E3 ubiquitin-protein ligase RGLG2-like [Punica granatum]XP_031383393.1 E3 ubiquitin-protein ligase RGLG2-like [Punica granatum]XP_031383394.1 E3 ubiquitin-protein ligase RGLG2-like [Punica granatum]
MGAKLTREDSWGDRESSSYRSSSSAWDNNYGYPQHSYNQENVNDPRIPSYAPPPPSIPSYAPPPSVPSYAPPPQAPQRSYQPPPQEFGGVRGRDNKKKLDRRYSRIADNYNSLEEVTEALARSGLESSNLIVGIDFTKSNEWTGAKSFNRRSLHHIGNGLNPYEQAISIIGKTLADFDEDNFIPCYGFGDASTHDQDVFSFYPDERFCNGFEDVLHRYKEIVPHLRLAGPTSFAPIIEMATTIVAQSGGQYHVLLIIADGQVTRSVDTERGQLSPQERKTVEAIVEASKFPLSIILVGVGDGPWDMMEEFDDNIPAREFDNFQFVNFTQIMSKNASPTRKETEFALSALMEIPSQYRATMELNLLGNVKGNPPHRVPLPPPVQSFPTASSTKVSYPTSFEPSVPTYQVESTSVSSAPPAPTYDNQICPICLTNVKDMAFGCGHQTCCDCGETLNSCPICRSPIQTRIKLY